MEIIIAGLVGQLAVLGLLFRWLHIQTRDNKQALEKIVKDSYTKAETKDMIDLKLEPLAVGIAHVQDELKEVKHMIGRLLDEKNKG